MINNDTSCIKVSDGIFYNESMQYDKNGNIMALQRNGNLDDQGLTLQIDNLIYRYFDNSNQLYTVTDAAADPNGFTDDSTDGDPSNDGQDYYYDANGNMIEDDNKGIEISYNHLNLPTEIDLNNGTIYYIYDATGKKVQKEVDDDTLGTGVVTDYLDGFQYKDDILQFFPTAEGYVNCNAPKIMVITSPFGDEEVLIDDPKPTFSYVYNYLDHLGNIRLSYSRDPQTGNLRIIEENHYYPFGLKHANYNSGKNIYTKEMEVLKIKPLPPLLRTSYSKKFEGKSWEDDLGLNEYDFGARGYMPDIVRTPTLDVMGEKFYSTSPYSFLNNNPLRFVDPTGMKSDDWVTYIGDNGQKQVVYDEGIKSRKEAEAKYKNVCDDFKSGTITGTSPQGSNYSYQLKENGSVVDSKGANVDKGFTTPQGTYVGENKSALSQLAPVLSNTGDISVVLGAIMVLSGIGAPIGSGLITYGGYASTTGTVMDLTNDVNNGTLTTEKAVTKGVILAIPSAGDAAFKALGVPAAGAVINATTVGADHTLDKLRDAKVGPYKEN